MAVRLIPSAFAAVVAAAALVVAALWWVEQRYVAPGPLEAEAVVVIPRGESVDAIADRLAAAGVVDTALVFAVGVRLEWWAEPLKAGEYAFPAGVSGRDAAARLRAGRTLVRRLTIPEGLTSRQVVARLAEADWLAGDIAEVPAEGTVLPETYHAALGHDRRALVAQMKTAMAEALAEAWARRSPDLPLASPEEALILASIVEKETAIAAERPRIAAVFLNRLRQGMPLQADPTVAYAVARDDGTLGRPLSRADLDTPSPYNTYLNPGLPPGPIANPGRAALLAVVNPADTDELYFVADGRGGHVFARTLAEHNRNVERWRQIERQRGTH